MSAREKAETLAERLIDTPSDEWGRDPDRLTWIMDARDTMRDLLDALARVEEYAVLLRDDPDPAVRMVGREVRSTIRAARRGDDA